MEVIKAAVIDRTGFYIEAVMSVLEQQPDIEVVQSQTIFEDCYSDLEEAEIIILQHESNTLTRRTIQQITSELQDSRLIVLGVPDDDQIMVDHIEAGAIGCIRETEPFEHLMQVIRVVHNGGAVVPPELIAPLCTRLADLGRSLRELYPVEADALDLTPRQAEVMALLTQGCTNQEIADELSISIGTVKNHVHKIFERLGVSSRDQASFVYARLSQEAET